MNRTAHAFRPMSARELKNSTGDVVRTLRRGESILLTFRGKPIGTIRPLLPGEPEVTEVPPYEEAWAEIEDQLRHSPAAYTSWREAEDASRGRR